MNLVDFIKGMINPLKIDIIKYPNADLRRRKKLFAHFKITKIIDVGANRGQYAMLIRKLGFTGKIISFEPLSKAYSLLTQNSSKDKNWDIYNYGLGDKNEELTINVSENSASSSILEIMSHHTDSAPASAYVGQEKIKIKTLDGIYHDLVKKDEIILLKIDVQGFEKNVIDGAKNVLQKITGVQLEMSLIELYSGELLFMEMITLLNSYGFKLHSLENGFYDSKTGQLLQVDGIFFRD